MRAPAPGARGFTLVEVATVLAIAGVLAAAAWPSWREQLLRGRRVEATVALQRLQLAQAGHHDRFGQYAQRLEQLAGGPGALSDGGHYRIALVADGGEGYRALAIAQGGQAGDRGCAEIELRVQGAVSAQLPSAQCWLP